MKPTVRLAALSVALGFAFVNGLMAGEYSHVRIVRLSFTEGTVSLQRPGSSEWVEAPVNTPIEEGFKLSTGKGGYAEVEFENGSTARLGEQSLLDFTQLVLGAAGNKINRMALLQGYGTFHAEMGKDDVYEVAAGGATLQASRKAEFRADVDGGHLRVEVFKGDVQVTSPQGSATLTKNKVLELVPHEEAFTITHGIAKDDWDRWVAERDEEADAANRPPVGFRGAPRFGWSDLYDYGQWSYLDGFGWAWMPYVGPMWSPFTLGQWCWYPSLGYTWISFEPWGWLPFHYGNWFFDPMFGWMWLPGSFYAWNPAPVNWYVGAGWVGWAPLTVNRPPKGHGAGMVTGGSAGCAQGMTCRIVTVSTAAFQSGKPVVPHEVRFTSPADGRLVTRLDLAPTPQAMLPGAVINPPAVAAAFAAHSRIEPGARPLALGRTPLDHSAPAMALPRPATAGFPAAGRSFARPSPGFGAWHSRSAPAVSPRRSFARPTFINSGGGWRGGEMRSSGLPSGGFSAPSPSLSVSSPAASTSAGPAGGHGGAAGPHR